MGSVLQDNDEALHFFPFGGFCRIVLFRHRLEAVGFCKTDNNDLDVAEFFELPSTVLLRVVSFVLL